MKFSNIISELFGHVASYEFPPYMQKMINKTYVNSFKIDLDEFSPIEEYKSLNALFTRKLIKMRSVNEEKNAFISPCDGLISEFGSAKDYQALQIKGFSYSLCELLKNENENLKNAKFLNLYLSPKDYHRYHAPCDMQVLKATHVPGVLHPVNFKALNKIASLFCKNERVILECKSEVFGVFYMVFVGALNVGKMRFCFDERIKTNAKIGEITSYTYEEIYLKKAQEMGMFEMGSTIVLIFENDKININATLQKVRFGEIIANM